MRNHQSYFSHFSKNRGMNILYLLLSRARTARKPETVRARGDSKQHVGDGMETGANHAALRGDVISIRSNPDAAQSAGAQLSEYVGEQGRVEELPAIGRKCGAVPDVRLTRLQVQAHTKFADILFIKRDPAIGGKLAVDFTGVALLASGEAAQDFRLIAQAHRPRQLRYICALKGDRHAGHDPWRQSIRQIEQPEGADMLRFEVGRQYHTAETFVDGVAAPDVPSALKAWALRCVSSAMASARCLSAMA